MGKEDLSIWGGWKRMFQLQLLKVVLVDFGLCGNEERDKWIFFFLDLVCHQEKNLSN